VLLKLVKYIITQTRARNLPPLKFPPRANAFNVDPARVAHKRRLHWLHLFSLTAPQTNDERERVIYLLTLLS